ncbi:sigma-54-dependent Fis family transcriptional regulator [Solimonas fluminis]|uniref:Sigma-54-dependent Fis family transcriptional regulator n=1 Tax=Solimonas fluminis TaxID=2086571 RepID=A0A2S5TIC0_9GAMM|nr:sigma-54 dependent transcriptional regulator [Solimonas fluminis]PPE74734.1 sigma-54-dependent Fis family transcriptional regulator [Solimonas fluminis]
MKGAAALIVDDEADIRELVEITLSRMGLKTRSAASLQDARRLLSEQSFDFCITDMRLPDGNGISLVQHIQKHHPQTPVAVITAYGSSQAAVESLKAGAFDFVSKPVDLQSLRKLVDAALKLRGRDDRAASDDGGLLGEHDSVRQLRGMIDRLARSQAPVHIAGESGTGKELVARLIHSRGPRAGGPFVPVNCGAIPSELMESEFFGHLKGSFTGALKDKPGLFQAAEGGTLFLDEVADLPLHMQVKLLRALQERAVRPVGSEAEVPVNVRITSATHKNLAELVARGAFRQDLFYRLNVIEVRTPPLRERAQDIPLLADHILARLARDIALPGRPTLDAEARKALQGYPFPGNVRELENILERAITLCDGEQITALDLQLRQLPGSDAGPAGGALEDQMEDIERKAIQDALEKARFNKTKAAELLGMSFRSLRYRIKKLGIE